MFVRRAYALYAYVPATLRIEAHNTRPPRCLFCPAARLRSGGGWIYDRSCKLTVSPPPWATPARAATRRSVRSVGSERSGSHPPAAAQWALNASGLRPQPKVHSQTQPTQSAPISCLHRSLLRPTAQRSFTATPPYSAVHSLRTARTSLVGQAGLLNSSFSAASSARS